MDKYSIIIPTLWKSNRIGKLLFDLIKCEFVDEICTGCYRTQDEAYEWYELTDEQRDIAWDRFVMQCKDNEKQEKHQ